MLDGDELVDFYFEEMLNKLDENKILVDWLREVRSANISSDLIEKYLKFKRSAEWKTSHINKASWKKSTKKNVRRIIALEDRFN